MNKDALSGDGHLNIRRATIEDLSTIVKLSVGLAQQHVDYDKQRFRLDIFEPVEQSHRNFMAKQLRNEKAVFLVAELNWRAIGYAFLRLEPASLGDLLGEGVWLHDIFFKENARGHGLGKRFFNAVIEAAKSLGSDSLMLTVSPHNTTAQRFFTGFGFRLTMQEMRIDFDSKGHKTMSEYELTASFNKNSLE